MEPSFIPKSTNKDKSECHSSNWNCAELREVLNRVNLSLFEHCLNWAELVSLSLLKSTTFFKTIQLISSWRQEFWSSHHHTKRNSPFFYHILHPFLPLELVTGTSGSQ